MRTEHPTAAQTAAALRTLVTSRHEGNFGNLTRAILGDDQTHFRTVNAQLWRAHSKKKPGHLGPELAAQILKLFPRSKGAKEKTAIAVIRAASKAPAREPKPTRKRSKKARGQRIRPFVRRTVAPIPVTAALQVQVVSGDNSIGTFVSTYDGSTKGFVGDVDVRVDDTEVVLEVRIPKSQALALFLQ